MADCQCLPGCPFYHDKMPLDSALGTMYKNKYCEGDNSGCARFMVFSTLGKGSVPADLYPNQCDRAKSLLGK